MYIGTVYNCTQCDYFYCIILYTRIVNTYPFCMAKIHPSYMIMGQKKVENCIVSIFTMTMGILALLNRCVEMEHGIRLLQYELSLWLGGRTQF